jgi:hypothetical protein
MRRFNVDKMRRHRLGTKPWRGPRPRRSSPLYQSLLHSRELEYAAWGDDKHAKVAAVLKGLQPWPKDVARPAIAWPRLIGDRRPPCPSWCRVTQPHWHDEAAHFHETGRLYR